MSGPAASVIIPLYNQLGFTKVCLEYLIRNTAGDFEVVIVDNASSDGTREFLATVNGSVKKIRNEANLGFAKACNQGARAATCEYLVFLNNDTVPHKGWLAGLLEPFGMRSDIGVTGPKLVYPDGTIQQAGVVFDQPGMPYHLYAGCPSDLPGANRPRFFRALTAACFAVPKKMFLELDGFDERYVNGMEDVDFCLRVDRMGKGLFYYPKSVVTHFESRSENRSAKNQENAKLFTSIWGTSGRFDDYRYLSQDGMTALTPDGIHIAFRTREEEKRMHAQAMAGAAALALKGDLAGAFSTYKELMNQSPYYVEVYERLEMLALKLRLQDVAENFRAQIARLTVDFGAYGREPITSPAQGTSTGQPSLAPGLSSLRSLPIH